MSQENKDKADAAEARTQQTKGFMQQVRVAARRKYTPEEKVRIVLEGFRREVAVRDLCRREGIKPGAFYAWTKDFMEAGKDLAEARTGWESYRAWYCNDRLHQALWYKSPRDYTKIACN